MRHPLSFCHCEERPLIPSLSRHVPIPSQTTAKILSILFIDVNKRPHPHSRYARRRTPSPLMGECWGEGEMRHPLSFCHCEERPLIPSLSRHVPIPSQTTAKILSILFIDVNKRPHPHSS